MKYIQVSKLLSIYYKTDSAHIVYIHVCTMWYGYG